MHALAAANNGIHWTGLYTQCAANTQIFIYDGQHSVVIRGQLRIQFNRVDFKQLCQQLNGGVLTRWATVNGLTGDNGSGIILATRVATAS